MKYNKWTVALAALGVVSFASAAKAEEQASSVMTALASTTLSGYVDTSAQWNVGTGNNNLPPYKFGGTSKADGFNLNVLQLRIDKPLDEQDWAAGYRADLWFGPDANVLGTTSTGAFSSDFAVRQAYVALRAPIGTGLDFKMGVFDSIIGYESIEAGNNPNFTRSYGHSIEPQTHTGLLATYRFCDFFSAAAGVADTWSPIINDRSFFPLNAGGAQATAESYKTYMGSVALTAPDEWGFLSGSTLYAGIVNGFADRSDLDTTAGSSDSTTVTSYYVGATIATPVTGLRAGASFDLLDIHHAANNTWAVAGYLSYQATEKLSFHGRAEYFKDKLDATDALLFNPDGGLGGAGKAEVLALTATAQYDLWKNVISRLEFRWDHSLLGNDLFGGDPNAAAGTADAAADLQNAWMVALNVIYKF
ncbi:MAG TPA: outer membrane beta-barrel protein [Candidatus Paceibacterota bacterium]|nr:outer membrane beta-barrel protein [Verrucomicrobiota bacterium]HSA09297.1 outer membrane beta-barrel protein [Candidatus Paceibacterota bacterium]